MSNWVDGCMKVGGARVCPLEHKHTPKQQAVGSLRQYVHASLLRQCSRGMPLCRGDTAGAYARTLNPKP
eukprot:351582-Chlamydomonas_euryale.AAC.2